MMQASMRAVFEDLGCSPCATKAMVEDQGIDTLDDLSRISNTQEVELGETTGEPTQDTWSVKRMR